jgi:SSS family transporter
MSPLDLAVIAAYVAGCTALGAWMGSKATGLKGYFLGESDIPAWAVMISIVATETSTVTFLSVPGVAYKTGGDFTFLQLPLGYVLGRIVIAVVLLPAYFRGEIQTAYQVLDERFGGPTRKTSSLLFLVSRALGDGLRLFLASKVLQQLTGWPIVAAILTVGAITVVYTFLGGMKAVIWTDVIQFSVYILGAIVSLVILARTLPGGFDRILAEASASGKFRVLDFSWDLTRPYTFWAGVLGGMVLNTATHGADQMMVQRYLSARSRRQAASALVASGFVVLAQFALFLFIGASLWVFYREFPPDFGTSSTGGRSFGSDDAFSYFIVNYLPTGLLGLVIAAIFSSAMGTLAGSLNSASSAILNDFYRPLTGHSDERWLVRVSRGLTIAWGAVLIGVALLATGIDASKSLVDSVLAIAAFTFGIVLGVFLLGVLTRRVDQRHALTGMLVGIVTVSYVTFATPLAYPWRALVGSSTVFFTGLAASFLYPTYRASASTETST